jgi:hypothetical protein
MDQTMQVVEKAALQAVITGGVTALYYGMSAVARVPYCGDCKLMYVATVVGGVTSLVNDLIHQFVKEEVHIARKAEDQASLLIGAGVGAAIYHLSLTAINPALARDTGLLMNASIGGGSEIAGSFVYNLIRG